MLLQKLYFLRKTLKQQWMKPQELEKLHKKRLRALIKHTYHNVIFYRKKWKSHGIRPEDIKEIKDLDKLPIIKRDEVIKNYNYFIAENYRHLYNLGKVTFKLTSGTYGTPMKMIFDERGEDYSEAIYLRSLLSLGYDIRKPIAYYWYEPFKRKFYHQFNFLKKNFIPSQLDETEQFKILQKINPEYICYFPSSLFSISKKMLKEGIEIKPKLIVTEGEILSKKMEHVIQKAFNAPVYDFYATTETGITAWECKEKNGYHINSDNVIINLTENGKEVSPGERGSIVMTSLMNYIFPLIRYEIGDIGISTDEKCSCGRALPLMRSVEGRTYDFSNRNQVTPKMLIDVIADIPSISNFKFIINGAKNTKVKITSIERLSKDDVNKIRRRIKSVLKGKVEIENVHKLQKESTGKIIMIETNKPF